MSIIDRIRGLFGGRTPPAAASASEGCPSADPGSEMIQCEDALRLVHDFLDGELSGVSQSQVQAHFDACQRCYPHLKLENAFRDAVRRAAAGEAAPPALREKVAMLIAEAEASD